jgi:NitT/TauT family transport system ATP-binding protein
MALSAEMGIHYIIGNGQKMTEAENVYVPPKISIREVSKVYLTKNQKYTALDRVSIDITENEFISVVGPSGCGKSTLLRMIAGLDMPTSGRIWVDGKEVTGPGAERGMVFQSYTLFPWLTVAENIAFGPKLKGMSSKKCRELVDKYLELIDLTDFADRYPKELSGGMKQRVAIARALANNPEVLLMDEPFGALDQQTKMSMQEMLLKIWRHEKITVIFVTHDIDEAIFLAQKVYVMEARPGRIKASLKVPLPDKRTGDIKDTMQFIKLRKAIVALLKNYH